MNFPLNQVYFGDCRESMRAMIAAGVKVNCIVTSPPYWGLRDYGHPGQLGLESTPDCRRPFMRLRTDLSDKQRQAVLLRLTELGLI